VRTGSPPVRRSASGVLGERRVSAFGVTSIGSRWPGGDCPWSLASPRRWFLLQRASPSAGDRAAAGLHSGGGLAQLQVSRIASTSFRVIRPVLFEVLRTS
jgi:hypothetical protein